MNEPADSPNRGPIQEDGTKSYALKAEQIEELAPNRGGCFASHRITVDGCKVSLIYREESLQEEDLNHFDSGWRFFAGDETEEYIDDHIDIYR